MKLTRPDLVGDHSHILGKVLFISQLGLVDFPWLLSYKYKLERNEKIIMQVQLERNGQMDGYETIGI